MSGFTYDVFISYAHLDDAAAAGRWVEQFRTRLEAILSQALGRKARVWQDLRRIDGNQLFDATIQEGLESSAVFLALLSRSYLKSDYCRRELAFFSSCAEKSAHGLVVGDRSRILNVRLMNIAPGEWPAQLAGMAGFDLFEQRGTGDAGYPLEPSKHNFREQIEAIATAVDRVLRGIEAPPAADPAPVSLPQAHGFIVQQSAVRQEPPPAGRDPTLPLKLKFRDDYQRCNQHSQVLKARKDLHDQLHELQLKFFIPVSEMVQKQTGIDRSLLEVVRDHSFNVGEVISEVKAVIARGILPESDTEWLAQVIEAREKLEKGIRNEDLDCVRAAVKIIGRVLVRWPTRINLKLNETARDLTLAQLAAELRSLCQQDPVFAAKLGSEVEKLEQLHQQIVKLVEHHDDWQLFDDELNLIEGQLKQNFSELEESWPFLKQKAEALCQVTDRSAVERLIYWSEEMDRALNNKNTVDAERFFIRYRSAARERFYAADQELKRGCQELVQVGRPIEAVLQAVH